ncbi:type VII secretion-associated serine protease mycosin [Mycolicibacterium mengxianglii]|uniref:type VII secretion-associated serine protease mycosin n=1 Tax=Mycolicibacterium mengxianglii TaxID=2736649 RepID=UPI0022B6E730|nr:type VII secretion-associated serine protease mycosin [Mycolicibacterium mengxianglii]
MNRRWATPWGLMAVIMVVVVMVVVLAGSATAPSAGALTAPAIDPTLLPAAAAPGPRQPSVQVETCTLPETAADVPDTTPDPLGFAAVRSLSRGEGQRVAVIDTGVTRHPRLAHLEAAGDYVVAGDGTTDCDGHGTIVAGIIAATTDLEDPTGFSGIAPAATVLTIRQSSTKYAPADSPTGVGVGDVLTLAMAVRTAADLGATVINISSIACAAGALHDGALGAALAYAVDTKDVVVVAAAGNIGGAGRCPDQPDGAELTWETATVAASPGWYDDYVLTVGSVDPEGAPSAFSLPGPWVDVAAPGERVVSLHPSGSGVLDTLPAFGRSLPISGTSYAAPVVSGLAALVRARFPELTAREVMRRIEETAAGDGWNPVTGRGVVDPAAAMSAETPVTQPDSPRSAVVVTDAPGTAGPDAGHARATAITGAAICAGLLLCGALITRARPHRRP